MVAAQHNRGFLPEEQAIAGEKMIINYATTNKNKVRSLQKRVDGLDIQIVQVSMDIPEPRSDDVQEIVREKVFYAYDKLKEPVVALDAGFYIETLNGFPKAFVNFALDTIGIEGIIKLMEDKTNRNCEFRECLAYLDTNLKEPDYLMFKIPGTVAHSPRGEKKPYVWSELSHLFIPASEHRTLCEMSEAEYTAWGEHGKPKEPFQNFLRKYVR
jgi:XTP/dITP diphosphohydrolase